MDTLAIEVEFLTGVSVAASPNNRDEPEWPPHPDRLFQALVAACGRNDPPDIGERRALEWFETLHADSLVVSARRGHRRDLVTVYVPPNDARTTRGVGNRPPKEIEKALNVIPDLRKNRQPRTFPAIALGVGSPHVRYTWKLNEEQSREFAVHRLALERLTREVSYLGHSHTLVRVALVERVVGDGARSGEWIVESVQMRVPYQGRLRYLEECYRLGVRPKPSLAVKRVSPVGVQEMPGTLFDPLNAIVLSDAGGFAPALSAFPMVARRLRDALVECASNLVPIPALLSGHDADGQPVQEPHLAMVPLADVGWMHASGRLMGLALVWPRIVAPADRRAVMQIIASFLKRHNGRAGLLHFGQKGSWLLTLDPEPERASLRFTRYSKPSRRWGTVLPVALDRHPKNKPGDELAEIIVRACLNIGLPKEVVDGLEVEVHKYAPVKGGPAVSEVFKSMAEDSPYRTKPFAHLVLTFTRPIRGPLILGAGRFRGLGFCLPIDTDKEEA